MHHMDTYKITQTYINKNKQYTVYCIDIGKYPYAHM